MIPFLDSLRALAGFDMVLVPYPLYPKKIWHKQKQSQFTLNSYMNTERQMSEYISFFKCHLKYNSRQERIQAWQWRIFKCKNCVIVVFYDLMFSETGPRADKMDTSKQSTFLLWRLISQMPNVTKQNLKWRILKEKIHFLYTECPANVCDKKKHPSTQPNTQPTAFIPIQLRALKC